MWRCLTRCQCRPGNIESLDESLGECAREASRVILIAAQTGQPNGIRGLLATNRCQHATRPYLHEVGNPIIEKGLQARAKLDGFPAVTLPVGSIKRFSGL